MKTATIKELKTDLEHRSQQDLIQLCLTLARFKKENKELLTYLLFESDNEDLYIASIKEEIDLQFESINTTSYYYIKKSVRKILRTVKKYIRYSKNKETELTLLLYFCQQLKSMRPSMERNMALRNLYQRQVDFIRKKTSLLHEDLQYDFNLELDRL